MEIGGSSFLAKLVARPFRPFWWEVVSYFILLWFLFDWDFSFCMGGITVIMSSKFELDKFMIAPTVGQFEKCRKDDLLVIADFYDIVVPRNALKREIKEALRMELEKKEHFAW